MNIQCSLLLLLFAILCVGCQKTTPSTADALQCLMNNDVAQLERLIQNGLSPNVCPNPESQDTTLLHLAGTFGSKEFIIALVDAGADIDATTDLGVTPLLAALTTGNSENALVLIKSGADVNLPNFVGAAPLHFAVQQKDLPVAQTLIEHGANVNARTKVNGGTPLSTAAYADSLAIAESLLDHGADANVVDNSGKKPIHYAKSDAMKRLLSSETNQ